MSDSDKVYPRVEIQSCRLMVESTVAQPLCETALALQEVYPFWKFGERGAIHAPPLHILYVRTVLTYRVKFIDQYHCRSLFTHSPIKYHVISFVGQSDS